jgi:hypothetical protein
MEQRAYWTPLITYSGNRSVYRMSTPSLKLVIRRVSLSEVPPIRPFNNLFVLNVVSSSDSQHRTKRLWLNTFGNASDGAISAGDCWAIEAAANPVGWIFRHVEVHRCEVEVSRFRPTNSGAAVLNDHYRFRWLSDLPK